MKNKLSYILLTLLLIFLSSTCELEFRTSNSIKEEAAPNVTTIGSSIAVTFENIPKNLQIKQITIYREEEDKENSEFTIGIIYPDFIKKGELWLFEDNNTLANHKYIYYAKYYTENDSIYITKKSKPVTASGPYMNKKLTYDASHAFLEFNPSSAVLTIMNDIIEPELDNFSTEYLPMILFQSPTSTQAFGINSIKGEIHLREIFPPEFFNCDVTILGILAQKTEYVSGTNAVKRIFTEPEPINIAKPYTNTINITKYNNSVTF